MVKQGFHTPLLPVSGVSNSGKLPEDDIDKRMGKRERLTQAGFIIIIRSRHSAAGYLFASKVQRQQLAEQVHLKRRPEYVRMPAHHIIAQMHMLGSVAIDAVSGD